MADAISVIYCFPRSGGTLLNQCLLCAPETVVLSEVNPAGSVVEPEKQAVEWFGLITETEALRLQPESYLEKIRVLHERTTRQNRRLCVRDWSGINFLPNISRWSGLPSLQMEQRIYLKKMDGALHEIALVRRSAAIYKSLRESVPECQNLDPEVFSSAYGAYLRNIAEVDKYRLEDLTADAESSVRAICDRLQLTYNPDFKAQFHLIKTVTGNTTLSRPPASAAWTEIRPLAPLPLAPSDPRTENIFRELDLLAGYEITR